MIAKTRRSSQHAVFADATIDCSGMACPTPIRSAKHALAALRVGQILKIIATESGAPADIREWAQRAGRELIASEEHDDTYVFYIKRTQ